MNYGIKKYVALCFLISSANSFAAYKDSSELTVEQISIWSGNGQLLLQTSPKPSIEGLNCSSDYWVKLDKNAEGYEAMLSILLAAQVAQKPIAIRIYDDAGTDFCRLDRVILFN